MTDQTDGSGRIWIVGLLSAVIGVSIAAVAPPSIVNAADPVVTATISIGSNSSPQAVAISPDGHTAYVTDREDSVSVIDTINATVTARIGVQHQPSDVAVSPDGKHVYVANELSGSVSVIDATTNAVTATIPLDSVRAAPTGLAVTPDGGYVYVANSGIDTVSLISTRTNARAIPDIAVSNPAQVAVAPDGTRVYVTNSGANGKVTVIAANHTVTSTIDVRSDPDALAITADGAFAYITHPKGGTVSVISTNTGQVTKTIDFAPEIGAKDVATTPDGAFAYITNDYLDTVSVVNTSNWASRFVSVGSHPWGVAISPDGALAYVANSWGGTVSVIHTDPRPAFSASPSALTFDDQLIGTTTRTTVIVANTGDADLVIRKVGLRGNDADQFSVDGTTCGIFAVKPAGECTVDVSFSPTSPGAKYAALEFTDDAFGSPHTVTLSGTARPAPTPTPTPSARKSQKPANARGIPPKTVNSDGVTLIQGANARTNTGQRIRALVTGHPTGTSAAGETRYLTVIRGPEGRVAVRTYGIPVRITVRQTAAPTEGYKRYLRKTVYVTR